MKVIAFLHAVLFGFFGLIVIELYKTYYHRRRYMEGNTLSRIKFKKWLYLIPLSIISAGSLAKFIIYLQGGNNVEQNMLWLLMLHVSFISGFLLFSILLIVVITIIMPVSSKLQTCFSTKSRTRFSPLVNYATKREKNFFFFMNFFAILGITTGIALVFFLH